MLAGARPGAARARIVTEPADGGFLLSIELEIGAAQRGTKAAVVPSCEEALDAAVLVLAVAVGETPEPVAEAPAIAPSPVSITVPARAVPSDREPTTSLRDTSQRLSAGIVVLGGVDANTLAHATPYVGAAVALLSMPIELRAAFRYGLRREDETRETDAIERTSAEFGALELSACRGVGSEVRLSLCAGGELGVVHAERQRTQGADSVDVDESVPRVAGVLTGWVARQVGAVRLELEVAGSAVAYGPEGASRASLRLGAGAGTQF